MTVNARTIRRFAGFLSVALGLLALAACAGTAGLGAPPTPTAGAATKSPARTTPTVPAVATPAPATTLPQWAARTIQPGFGTGINISSTPAPRPGTGDDIAYSCATPASGPALAPRVLVTGDAGRTWTRAADVPVGGARVPGLCSLVVDQITPTTVAATVSERESGPGPSGTSMIGTFVSFDGAAHWQALGSAPEDQLWSLATYQGRIYAVRVVASGPALFASTDQMHTWQRIDQGAAGGTVGQFWVNPQTGTLLALSASTGTSLSTSVDGGQNGSVVNLPEVFRFVVVGVLPGDAWHICGVADGGVSTQPYCTTDGGRSWGQRPALTLCAPCAPGQTPEIAFAGLAPNGDLLALGKVASQSDPSPRDTLYRLPATGTAWQNLGMLPAPAEAGVLYQLSSNLTVSGQILLWAIPLRGARSQATETFYTAALPLG